MAAGSQGSVQVAVAKLPRGDHPLEATIPALKLDKRRVTTALGRYLINPIVRAGVRAGVLRGYAILETTGRRSGEPRRTPVGNGCDGDTFWIVTEHGRRAAYVRNIEADPRVRVMVGRRWRSGTAHLLPEDDPLERQRKMGRRLNAATVRALGTELMTVRIDLEPASGPPARDS